LVLTTLWALRAVHAASYPISSFDQLRGLVVADMYEDSRGYIWMATETGLWRGQADGFKPVTEPTTWGKPSHVARTWGKQGRCILEDDHGTLWIGTDHGLIALDVESLEARPVPEVLRQGNIDCLYLDRSGRFWAGTENGPYRVKVQGRTASAERFGAVSQRVFSVAPGKGDDLWMGVSGALLHVVGNQVQRFMEDRIGEGPVTLLRASDGVLWIGLRHDGGLYRMVGERTERMTAEQGLRNDDVNAIVEAPDGDIWVATENGAFRWTGKRFLAVDRESGLANSDVHSLLVDRESQVWIGTFGSGVFQIRSPDILTYDMDDGLSHPMVTALARDARGRLMVGTLRSACYFDPQRSSNETIGHPHNIRAIHVDSRGEAWIGSQEHVWLAGVGRPLNVSGRLFSMADNPDGGILVGTSMLLYAFDGQSLRPVDLPAEVRPPVFAILTTPSGAVYLGTGSGLLRRTAEGWEPMASGFPVRALTVAPDGSLWLGTDRALLSIRPDRPGEQPTASWSTTGRVNALTLDAEGTLWAATSDGLLRLRKGSLERFTLADGLPSRDIRAVLPGPGDILFAGTTHGLARIDTRRLVPCTTPPRLSLQFWSAGRMVGSARGGALQVPFAKQDILARVSSLGWRSAVGVRYQCRLVGRDATWSSPSSQNLQRFTDLPPGRYTFQARAINARGIKSDVPAEFSFSILAPYWRRPWFLAAAGGIFVAIVLLVGRLRARRIQLAGERRRSEAAIRGSEQKFHTLADTVAAAAFIFRDSRIIYANPAAEAMVGYSLKELLKMKFWDVIHPDFRDLVRQRGLGRQRGEAVPDRYEVKILTRSGQTRWVDFTAGMIEFEGVQAVLGTAFDITERKMTDNALRLTQFAIDHTSDAAFWVRPDGRFMYVNQAACELHGYTRDELLSMRVFDIDPEFPREKWPEHWAEISRLGFRIFSVYHCKKNGKRFPVEITATHVNFEGEQYICAFARDISERRLAEVALRESEERFRTLVEHAPEAILLYNVDSGRFADANENALKLTKRSREELYRIGPADISPPFQPDGRPSRDAAEERVQQALQGKSPVFEWTHQSSDGMQIPCEVRLVRLPSTDQRLIRASITDISQRVRTEKVAGELAKLADENPSPVLRVAGDGTILYANSASMACLNAWERCVGQRLPEPWNQKAAEVLESGAREEVEIECGGLVHSVMFTPVPDAGYVNLYARDITQRRQAEEQLRQSQKLEAVGTLASGVAHEFDNLLSAIFTYTELAKSAIPPSHQAMRALEKVEQVAKQARGVTMAMLTFSHRAVIPKSAVNLSRHLEETAGMLGRLLPARIEIVESIPSDQDLWIKVDAGQLQQILMNMALNAKDAMPEGGQLRISLRDEAHSAADSATNKVAADGDHQAVLTVEDTGCGMSPPVLSRIFEPFFTTKPRGEGTGLGMSLVHSIVEDLGGEIAIQSKPQQGTRISITLPRIEPPDEPSADQSPRIAEAKRGKIILVLEKNEHILSIITSTLRSRGFDVLPARDMEEAIGALRNREHLVGLIIVDLDVTSEDGLMRLVTLQKRHEDLPVVILAGTLSINLEAYGLGGGFLLRKPFQMGQLTAVVDRILSETGDKIAEQQ